MVKFASFCKIHKAERCESWKTAKAVYVRMQNLTICKIWLKTAQTLQTSYENFVDEASICKIWLKICFEFANFHMKICSSLQFEMQNLTKNCENFAKFHMKIYNCKIQPANRHIHIYKYESCRQNKSLLWLKFSNSAKLHIIKKWNMRSFAICWTKLNSANFFFYYQGNMQSSNFAEFD